MCLADVLIGALLGLMIGWAIWGDKPQEASIFAEVVTKD